VASEYRLAVSICDTNDTEKVGFCVNEAVMSSTCSIVLTEQLPKIDGHFPIFWMKDQ
jgi:hypothetical protein